MALGVVSGEEVSVSVACDDGERERSECVFALQPQQTDRDGLGYHNVQDEGLSLCNPHTQQLVHLSSRPQTMVVFEGYPEPVLHELSRVVLHDTHLANTTCELYPSLSPSSPSSSTHPSSLSLALSSVYVCYSLYSAVYMYMYMHVC